jgi:D-galacturonate reductase
MIPVCVIGGGMITREQILPSLYHLQRLGQVGEIDVCAQHGRTVLALRDAPKLAQAFPGHGFRAWPGSGDPEEAHPKLYETVLASLPARSLVVIALPDHIHFEAALAALEAGHHVLAVKPLVLRVADSEVLEREARARDLLVTVEFHKRCDDRALIARGKYRAGQFGEFRLGTARLFEKWHYRHSNFQNWFTPENSDSFTYVGCHYVDLVHFITGLEPAAVSVYGVKDRFPNGKEGYLWTDARVIWKNGACLNVQNALSFPDDGPGSNTQGFTLYCSDGDKGGMISHSDQNRGLSYVYTARQDAPGATAYSEPNPDFFQYVEWSGGGLRPAGYGYRSIENTVRACLKVEGSKDRAALLREIDEQGILATPANGRHTDRVAQAGRESILNEGRLVSC